MAIFKRGRVYWFHFVFNGEHIQQSTKQGNPRVARQIESAYKTQLAKGEVDLEEREKIPSWLMRELLSRLKHQFELPTPKMKVCRGRMFSVADYTVDVAGMGFADVVGGENERKAG